MGIDKAQFIEDEWIRTREPPRRRCIVPSGHVIQPALAISFFAGEFVTVIGVGVVEFLAEGGELGFGNGDAGGVELQLGGAEVVADVEVGR